jgi:hypothetical protein
MINLWSCPWCPLPAGGLAPLVPRLKKIWTDEAYREQELADWCTAQGERELEIVERSPGKRGFRLLVGQLGRRRAGSAHLLL